MNETKMKRWTKEEQLFLVSNINKMTYKDFSKNLNRTISSIKNKAVKLKIFKEDPLKIGAISKHLTLIDFRYKNTDKKRYKMLVCECVCGNIVETHRFTFLNGFKKSCGCLNGKEAGVATWNSLYRQYKHDAKKRKYVFDLNIQQFKTICSNNCYYCNIEPKLTNHYVDSNGNHYRPDISIERVEKSWVKNNGIDRVDNSVGYIITNCVASCVMCNQMKMDQTEREFLNKIKTIYEFKIGEKNGK
jgi:hypothetical protein